MNDMATPKYKELWTIKLSTRDEFQLDGEQFAKVRDRMRQGDLGLVELKDGGFKISHIVCWNLDSRQIANQLETPEKNYDLTPEERAKGRKKLEEIRQKVFAT